MSRKKKCSSAAQNDACNVMHNGQNYLFFKYFGWFQYFIISDYFNISNFPWGKLLIGPDHVQLNKVIWRLKVNWKFFWQKFRNIFTIHFTCSESCGLSKVNCNQWNSIGTPISQLELQLFLQKSRIAAQIYSFLKSQCC